MRSPRSSTVDVPVTLLIADTRPALGNAPEAIRRDLAQHLSRADRVAAPAGGATRTLFHLFGFDARGELPVAAVTRSVDADNAAGGAWLRADPAWMDVGSALVLKGWGDFGLEHDAVNALAEALAEPFGEAGFEFSAPDPARWYVRTGAEAGLATTPPDELIGRDASDHLPEGNRADIWRRLMSECQMVLHNHWVNRDRRTAGLPPVNSLWFWGAGRLPEVSPGGFSRVVGGGAVAQGLWDLPGGSDPSGGTLLVADGAETDRAVWEHWAAARPGAARVLVPDARRGFAWRARHRFRVWRRRQGLEELLAPGRDMPA